MVAVEIKYSGCSFLAFRSSIGFLNAELISEYFRMPLGCGSFFFVSFFFFSGAAVLCELLSLFFGEQEGSENDILTLKSFDLINTIRCQGHGDFRR